jgi:hypothetical protein
MKHIFHTEDCGISLICRCCRGLVCQQRLTRSDRLRVRRELWEDYSLERRGDEPQSRVKNLLRVCAAKLIQRVAHWTLADTRPGK